MSTTLQRQESLPYELLLRKSCDACQNVEVSSNDAASTVEPPSSSESSAGSDSDAVARAPPSRQQVQLLRNVAIHGPHGDERLAALIQRTRELSNQVFEEDCLQEVTRKSGWKLSLLVSDDLEVLCGFIVAKVTKGTLSIAKLAVPAEFRGHGFGKLVMEQLMAAARKQGDVYEVCLSSLSTAVTFYQRLGFKAFKGMKFESGEDLVEGQVYMEKKLRPRRK
mmetsp:Transcript_28027/g.70355  ORF Transcript_28027/g.70355 Transcript_28027/m.70355 type:complete len:222 (-) Transcript_28027:128-793(-)